VNQEFFIGACKAGNEVVLPYADCLFGGVAAVAVRRCKLEVDFLLRIRSLSLVDASLPNC
jgi:hypothetical protein